MAEPTDMQMLPVRINVNGENWQGAIPAHETLLEFIRVRLGLTGTKRSCESQVCGACTVLVDEQPISSCNYLACEAQRQIGADHRRLVPGTMSSTRYRKRLCAISAPSAVFAPRVKSCPRKRCCWPIRRRRGSKSPNGFPGNICRCGAYPAIVASVQEAARQGNRSVQ